MLDRINLLTRSPLRGELVCLVALAGAIVAVAPFSSGPLRSDGAWESLRFADALDQVNRGHFPVYVGQSDFVPDGTPNFENPGYHFTGVVLHLLTFRSCSPATVQWLVTAYCMLGGVCAAYLGLRVVFEGRRWVRLLSAALYVVACGILLQLGFGSGPAFAAVPYVPLHLYMLHRASRKPDAWTAAGLAALLAIIWLSHAPTGLGATLLTAGVFLAWGFTDRRRQVARLALLTAVTFGFLSAWYFTSADTLGLLRVRPEWLVNQCAMPVALAGAAGALYVRSLLNSDRWEAAFQYVRASGEIVHLGRAGWNATRVAATLVGLALFGVVAILWLRAPGLALGKPGLQLRSLLGSAPSQAQRFDPVRDPVLHDLVIQLTPKGGNVTRNADFVPVRDDRLGRAVPQPEFTDPDSTAARIRAGRPFLHFRVEPNRRYVLTLAYWTKSYRGELRLDGETIHQAIPLPEETGDAQSVRLLVAAKGVNAETVSVSLHGVQTTEASGGGAYCTPLGLTAYRPQDLPIRVVSESPFKADVEAVGEGGLLITHRRFVRGYKACVNGQRVDAFPSPEAMVVIPLRPGSNEVRLVYEGTVEMQVAFAVSAVSWLALLVAAVRNRWRRKRGSVPAPLALVPAPARAVRRAA